VRGKEDHEEEAKTTWDKDPSKKGVINKGFLFINQRGHRTGGEAACPKGLH